MKKPIPSQPIKRIRLTIPVTLEVHAAFTRISKATGTPVGRSMGEWLGDTLDAAEYLAQLLEEARAAPRKVAQQLHAYAHGLTDEAGQLLEQIRKDPATRTPAHAQRGRAAGVADTPPPCNTGGKVPPKRGKAV